jgi:hypothetical protein
MNVWFEEGRATVANAGYLPGTVHHSIHDVGVLKLLSARCMGTYAARASNRPGTCPGAVQVARFGYQSIWFGALCVVLCCLAVEGNVRRRYY